MTKSFRDLELEKDTKKSLDLVFYVGLSEVIRRGSLRYLLPAYSVQIWRSLAVEIDINELVLLFKGLLLTEKKLDNRKQRWFPSPALVIYQNLKTRLSPGMLYEISIWSKRIRPPSLKSSFTKYRLNIPQFPDADQSGFSKCHCCNYMLNIPESERYLPFTEYHRLARRRQELKDFEDNKCPQCEQVKLKTQKTRWGVLRVCGNYPICDYFEQNSERLLE